MNLDFVSVVIPCYNQGRFLGEALESVRQQTHTQWEVVVVDDGSTDETARVAARYDWVRLLRQSNRGLAAARNAGLRASNGAYTAFLDADDRLRPEALARGLHCLAAHPKAAFAYGRYANVTVNGGLLPPPEQAGVAREHYLHLLRTNYIGMHGAVLYRRGVFEVVGGFNEQLDACEDYELYFRIARRFPLCSYPEVVAEYRQHDSNMTRDVARMTRATSRVLDAQRPYIQGDGRYEAAYAEGVRFWQSYYGERLLDDLLSHWRHPNHWRDTLRRLLVLVQYYPQGLLERIKQKQSRLWRGQQDRGWLD